jgi:hypothetical protein
MVNPDICANGFLTCNNTIGILVGSATMYTTGDLFLTLFWFMMILVGISLMFGIRLEYSMIIILPLLLGYMAYYKSFVVIGVVVGLYLGIVATYNFIIR